MPMPRSCANVCCSRAKLPPRRPAKAVHLPEYWPLERSACDRNALRTGLNRGTRPGFYKLNGAICELIDDWSMVA